MIFSQMISFQSTVIIRYFFNMYTLLVYKYFLTFSQLIQSSVIYLVCHFFAMRISQKQSANSVIVKLLTAIFVVFILGFCGLAVY